jgi:hypothetical protein
MTKYSSDFRLQLIKEIEQGRPLILRICQLSMPLL